MVLDGSGLRCKVDARDESPRGGSVQCSASTGTRASPSIDAIALAEMILHGWHQQQFPRWRVVLCRPRGLGWHLLKGGHSSEWTRVCFVGSWRHGVAIGRCSTRGGHEADAQWILAPVQNTGRSSSKQATAAIISYTRTTASHRAAPSDSEGERRFSLLMSSSHNVRVPHHATRRGADRCGG